MSRQVRMKSSTGIYHIMIRGINKEQIFNSVVHKNKIIEIIKSKREDMEFGGDTGDVPCRLIFLLTLYDNKRLRTRNLTY